MRAEVFWIPGALQGRIGITTRPRGGDWLKDELRALREAGADLLVSMLTPSEVRELQLEEEEALCRNVGLSFQSLPVPDRGVPGSAAGIRDLALDWAELLASGTSIVVHCRQGIGRSALMVASVLVALGHEADSAFQTIADSRGRPVPDTEEQRSWVARLAASMQGASTSRVAEREARYDRATSKSSDED